MKTLFKIMLMVGWFGLMSACTDETQGGGGNVMAGIGGGDSVSLSQIEKQS